MINYTEKGEEDLFHLTLPRYDPSLREVRQDTKEFEGEITEECSFLVCHLLF